MKELIGHRCNECGTIVLERRRRPAAFCPVCRLEKRVDTHLSGEPVPIARLDKADFPKKEDPRQLQMFAPVDGGGLF